MELMSNHDLSMWKTWICRRVNINNTDNLKNAQIGENCVNRAKGGHGVYGEWE